ncbi:MAG: VOC family protein [Pseudonocardiales bacterium]
MEALKANGASFRNETVIGKGVQQILLEGPAGNLVELVEPFAR